MNKSGSKKSRDTVPLNAKIAICKVLDSLGLFLVLFLPWCLPLAQEHEQEHVSRY